MRNVYILVSKTTLFNDSTNSKYISAGIISRIFPRVPKVELIDKYKLSRNFGKSLTVNNEVNNNFFVEDQQKNKIMQVEQASGKIVWTHNSPVVPNTMAVNYKGLFFHNGKQVVALKPDGADNWKGEEFELKKYKLGTARVKGIITVNNNIIAEAEWMATMVKRKNENT